MARINYRSAESQEPPAPIFTQFRPAITRRNVILAPPRPWLARSRPKAAPVRQAPSSSARRPPHPAPAEGSCEGVPRRPRIGADEADVSSEPQSVKHHDRDDDAA